MALVIGNARYDHVSDIPNSANDARDVAAALGRIGFVVTEKYNLDYRDMRLILRDFSEETDDADMVLVYFAGHGIEIDNTNYLIPTNAELRSDKDVEFEAIRLETMLNSVSTAKGLKLVLVDACRNNPFVSQMVRTTATRSIGRGLGRIDPGGVLVGYSARSGTLALDGVGRNSPYAQALLEHIEVPGLELGKLFRKVRDTVFDLTEGYQEPFTYGSLPGRDIFLVPAAIKAPSTELDQNSATAEPLPADEREDAAQRVLREALKLEDDSVKKGALEMIAQLYPNTRAGQYAGEVAGAIGNQAQPKTKASDDQRNAGDLSFMSKNTADQGGRENTQQDMALETETALNLSRSDYRSIQRGLNALGYSAGPVDGIFGARSRAALRRFQGQSGSEGTGYLTEKSYAVLKNIAKPEPPLDSNVQPDSRVSVALPNPRAEASSPLYGDYVIDISRRANPNGKDAGSGTKLVLRLHYRKSANGFQLISAQEFAKGGASRSKSYSASLSDSGQLRVSGRTNYLFKSSIVVGFSISQNLPPDFSAGRSLSSTQGRFDKNWFVDVRITKR